MEVDLIFYFNVLLLLLPIITTETNSTSKNPCKEQKTCGQCMSVSPQCVWCLDPTFVDDRCDMMENIRRNNCSREFVYDQPSSQNSSIDNGSFSLSKNPIQMSPNRATLKLRPNELFRVPVTFAITENFPLDIYFLFDTSHTMIKYTNILANLTDQLVVSIAQLTSSYRIGFGSFVDKETLPFVRVHGNRTFIPCTGCLPGYSFINHMNLSSDVEAIKENLRLVSQSGNLDTPEGGFDAIVQAVTCEDVIGWREYSRKMVILFTDAKSHIAGDGKLAGIVEPNGLECRLDRDGRYTWSTREDYPSISQLALLIEDKRIHLIFAVTGNALDWYTEVSRYLPGSSVGELSENPDNVIRLVADNFRRIQRSIHLTTRVPDGIDVIIRSSCSNGSEKIDTAVCHGVQIGQAITFDVMVRVKSCMKTSFNLIPVGIKQNLLVNVEDICSCNCEEKGEKKMNNTYCNGNGDLACGVCNCHPGHYGGSCEYVGDEAVKDAHLCRPSQNNTDVCSERGLCQRGRCICFHSNQQDESKKYYGKFCECSDSNCVISNEKLCSGRGTCKCGQCKCFPGFSMDDCSCSTDTTACIASNGKECNGKGKCRCGVCDCNDDSTYKGVTCEDCPTCPGMCQQHAECVSCYFTQKDDPCHKTCRINVTGVTQLPELSNSTDENVCRVRGDDNCYLDFVINHGTRTILLKNIKECIKINYFVVVGSVVGGIIMAGVAALVAWKAAVTVYDTKEYRAFENEINNAKWEETINPLYKQAVSKYNNPTFRSKAS